MKGKNVFWGLFFIVAAGVIIVNQLGYLAGITTFNLIITILLVPIIIKSILDINFFGTFFGLAVLGILFAGDLGITDFVPIPILATALFLSIGFSLVFGKYAKYFHFVHITPDDFDEEVNIEDGDVVNYSVKFGGGIKYVNSKNFKRANFHCRFGGLTVYLDNAIVGEEGAVINVDVAFGGVEIYVPKQWNVVNEVEVTMGEVEMRRNRYEHPGPTVKIVGKASFSGVEIIYV